MEAQLRAVESDLGASAASHRPPARIFKRCLPAKDYAAALALLLSLRDPPEERPDLQRFVPDDEDSRLLVNTIEDAFPEVKQRPAVRLLVDQCGLTDDNIKMLMAYKLETPYPVYRWINGFLTASRRSPAVVEHVGPAFTLLYRALEKLPRVTANAQRAAIVRNIPALRATFDNFQTRLAPGSSLNFWGFSSFTTDAAVMNSPCLYGGPEDDAIVYVCGQLTGMDLEPFKPSGMPPEHELLPLCPAIFTVTAVTNLGRKVTVALQQEAHEDWAYVAPGTAQQPVPRGTAAHEPTPPKSTPPAVPQNQQQSPVASRLWRIPQHWTDDEILRELPNQKSVAEIDASKCIQLTDASITAITEHCPQLQYLNVSRTHRMMNVSDTCGSVTDLSIMAVALFCPELQHLDVTYTRGTVTDVSITCIAQHCPQLQHLNVSYTDGQVTDASIAAVAQHCRQLQRLDVSNTGGKVTDASITAVAQHCPQLQHLNVPGTDGKVTDASIAAVAQHCPQLQRLDVSNTGGKVTDASITAVARHCPQLQHLNVASAKVTDTSITCIAQHCPQLQHLNVRGTDGKVTDASITCIAQHCPQLQHLDVSRTDANVTDASITAVARHCPQLQHLNVAETDGQVTDASITCIAQHCPQLQHLNVCYTWGKVTDASITAVAQHCPQLQDLNVLFNDGRVTDASLKLLAVSCRVIDDIHRSEQRTGRECITA